jgi:hypothetical protein
LQGTRKPLEWWFIAARDIITGQKYGASALGVERVTGRGQL